MGIFAQNANLGLNWRLAWYSSLIWLVLALVSNLVVYPWFYLALPAAAFLATAFYFRGLDAESIFAQGLRIGIFWFFVVITLDFFVYVGFDWGNFYLYLIDNRSFLKFPVVILVPVFYALLAEQRLHKTKALSF